MNRVKNFFTKNLGLKSLSLVLAIILWFVGMNINNPTLIQTFTVNLELRNLSTLEDNNLIILNEDELLEQKIDLRVRGSRVDLLELQRNYQNYLKAYIDFAPLDVSSEKNIGTKFYMTVNKPNLSSNYEVLDNYPRSVEVLLDKIVVEEKNIEVEVDGTIEEGYVVAGDPIVSPETVTFEGASTLIDEIKRVVVYMELEGKTSSVTETLPIKIINQGDEDITDKFTIETTEAEVTVKVLMQKNIPLVKPVIIGEPKENFKLKNVTYSVDYIEVVGEKEDIESVDELALESINLANTEADFVVTQDLERLLKELNPNLSIRNGTPKFININFDLEEYIQNDFVVSSDSLSIKGLQSNMSLEETYTVTIEGYKTDIDALTEDDIEGSVDLRNIEVGETQVDVSVVIPEGVTLVGQPTINVSYVEETTEEEVVDETGE
ncbi:MAG: YbbR-like domain-containing protein [Lachnospirales bacterium]